MKMELWEVEPGHTVACIRSVRGEIPIPTFLDKSLPVNLVKLDTSSEAAAIADDALLPIDDDGSKNT
jgi:hypothetical protein